MHLLEHWSRRINLIGPGGQGSIWNRHVLDSLQLLPFLHDRDPPFVDLGSGAGFPGLVLAIASGAHVHLIEADRRKAAFLREASRVTGAPVTVHCRRIDKTELHPVTLVTARALAPLRKLLDLAEPFLRPDGVLLAMKGARVGDELTAARAEWHMRVAVHPSRTDSSASILQISDVRRAREPGTRSQADYRPDEQLSNRGDRKSEGRGGKNHDGGEPRGGPRR